MKVEQQRSSPSKIYIPSFITDFQSQNKTLFDKLQCAINTRECLPILISTHQAPPRIHELLMICGLEQPYQSIVISLLVQHKPLNDLSFKGFDLSWKQNDEKDISRVELDFQKWRNLLLTPSNPNWISIYNNLNQNFDEYPKLLPLRTKVIKDYAQMHFATKHQELLHQLTTLTTI